MQDAVKGPTAEVPLFRPEAMASTQVNRFGRVLIQQPLGYTVSALLAVALIALIAAFAYFGTYTRKATVTGLLMPEQGIFRLASSGAGYIAQVKVKEGQAVEPGDVLFVVSGERLSAAGATQQLISEQLNQRQLLLQRNRTLADERTHGQLRMLDARLRSVEEEQARLSEEVQLLGRRVELSHAHLKRQQELVAANFISLAQLQQSEADLLALQGQQQSLRRTQANLRRERTDLLAQRQDTEHRHQGEISDIDSSVAVIRQEQAENEVRGEQIIAAPFSGVVTGLSVQPGQQVAAGALLASVIPRQVKLAAHVYVAARQAGFVEPGQTALMRYAAYPYQKFGSARATVQDIVRSPYALQELPAHIASVLQSAEGATQLFYRVSLAIEAQDLLVYGQRQPLQVGMLLEADIIQDKRRIYEWALEPIYSVTGKWSTQ
ncbi:HlyD family efflux transporter periplasmic adaptor subunit [Pseudomonas sp. LJDD11]|uniref:HlyD family secretion protein n=1 Tax=unclassified Pseudomonas TaxID=196821 RepID=UPI0004F62B53|nr:MULTISPECIES: HlyD family efflux transporter periplasmic adaptor subunit [unclassified Pseudomonas]MCQ9427030.1 HlyD family efflux transporter periplasmic adaptor subunit [Pseudomonas sp. LJDD11]BAP44936.1 putative secretion protein [Pseudomonas sp. StFLB209]